jgi:predicted transcriptional regulator
MLRMDQAYVIRHKVLVEGVPVRRVARDLGVSRNTVRRYLDGATKLGERKAVARVCARCRIVCDRDWRRCWRRRLVGQVASSA